MESTLFVPVNLSFSENLRCLKMPLLVGAISQKRWPSETCFVFAGQNVNSGKFKHLKYSENVKFTGTNYIDSILDVWYSFNYLLLIVSGNTVLTVLITTAVNITFLGLILFCKQFLNNWPPNIDEIEDEINCCNIR